MFRLVALAEIGLKVLYTKETKKKAPEDNHSYNTVLLPWYEGQYGTLVNIVNARKQVNRSKHRKRNPASRKYFETLKEGIDGFNELLSLLERI